MRIARTTRLARAALHSLGLVAVLRWLRRNGVRILMYHRFDSDSANLRRQCEHIRRRYAPVSLQQVAASIHGGRPLPSNALAVTVDDGYRDFLTYAHPVLHAFDIPTTVFLVTDFIDGGFWLWWDMFAFVIQNTHRQDLTFALPDGSICHCTLGSDSSRRAAHATICASLTRYPAETRLRTLAEIARVLDVTVPPSPSPDFAPLSWDEVRTLASRGVEFGAHTRTHPILSCVTNPERLQDEIMWSKQRIESETGRPVVHFCYPNGRRQDFTDDAVDIVRRGGFLTAVTTEPGINFSGQRPWLLRRIGVQPEYPAAYFEELLAGVRTS